MVYADTIFSSDAVFTGLENLPKPGAIAIKNNTIIATGSKEEIKRFIGSHTKEFHFDEQLIMPGFHDAHIHLMLGSLFTNGSVDLSTAKTSKEAVKRVKQFADQNPDDDWIIGYGWDHINWDMKEFPNRFHIDIEINDRPVLLFHAEGHYTWVNSKSLEIAGVTSQPENPPAGIVEKDDKGEPTGILIEKASSLVTDIALKMPKKKQQELLDGFLQQAAKFGVTSINDLYASSLDPIQNLDLFKEYDEACKLTVRIHLYPPLNEDFENAKKLRETYTSEKLKFTGLKQFIDGVVTGHTAYMLDPYVDKPESCGSTVYSEEVLRDWVLAADKEGFQIRFHTIGDGAVQLGLDLFEEAQKINGIRDSRHALEHIEVIHPEDIVRFERLGVIPSIQPSHIALMPKESHTTRVHNERFPYLYPSKSLKGSTNNLVFGTDYPISSLNPLEEIYFAVTRLDYTENEVWNEQETVSVADALKAYTQGPAYSVFRENELGTIEQGKLADIVVLDQNLFNTQKKEIKNAKVLLTMIDGKIIYTNESIQVEETIES